MSAEARKALGRGLQALLPDLAAPSPGQIAMVRIDRIDPNPFQPRRTWNERDLASLADSIREQGILQPLVLRRRDMRFDLVAGERRLRAARMAGLVEVPAVIREATDSQMLALALVENIQRQDLGPIEKAEAFSMLSTTFSLTQEEMGRQTGLDRSTVSNFIRLLELPEEVKAMLREGDLSMGHGRALLSIAGGPARTRAARMASSGRMSVRQLEDYARRTSRGRRNGRRQTRHDTPEKRSLEERLTSFLGLRVRIRDGGGHGRVEIEYSSLEELDGLLEKLGG